MTPQITPNEFNQDAIIFDEAKLASVDENVASSLRMQIAQKTGLSVVAWAAMYMPVLSVQEGLDLHHRIVTGMTTRLIGKSDLAARLRIRADEPFGAQLRRRGKLSFPEATMLDRDFFEGLPVEAQYRIGGNEDTNLSPVLSDLLSRGLVKAIVEKRESGDKLLLTLATSKFSQVCQVLSSKLPHSAILVSLNGSILYF